MKLNLEINNLVKNPLRKDFLTRIVRRALEVSGSENLKKKKISISLAVVDLKEMKKLNKQFRGINKSTDVLSFAEYPSSAKIAAAGDKELFLGEVIICYDDIKTYATRKRLDVRQECARVVAHGVLHLVGFRHGRKMFSVQEEIGKKYGK